MRQKKIFFKDSKDKDVSIEDINSTLNDLQTLRWLIEFSATEAEKELISAFFSIKILTDSKSPI